MTVIPVPALLITLLIFSVQAMGQTAGAGPSGSAGLSPDARDRNLYEPLADGFGAYTRKTLINTGLDQRAIWLSPFHMNRTTARWWLVAAAGTGALIAYDYRISQQLPNAGPAVDAGTAISRAGQYYSVYPFAAAMYYFGVRTRNPEISETGALAIQGLIDSAIVGSVIKIATGRERPRDGDGGGHFGHGGTSFPSGHSIEAWTLATVIARRYGHHKWVPAVSYGYATLISVSRVAARQHFPSDVFAGAAMGFFIGKYVVNENHLHRGHVHRQVTWLQPLVSPYLAGGGLGVQLSWSIADPQLP